MNVHYGLRDIIGDERLQRFSRYMDPSGLVVGGEITPRWMLDGASFWYADRVPEDTVVLRVDGKTGTIAPLLDVAKTRRALSSVIGREVPYRGLPFDSLEELGQNRY